jgi:hypothetical protein
MVERLEPVVKRIRAHAGRACGAYGAHLRSATERSAAVPGRSKSRIFEYVGEYPCACTADIAAPETGALRRGVCACERAARRPAYRKIA